MNNVVRFLSTPGLTPDSVKEHVASRSEIAASALDSSV
jgi:hypothetical protein